jgi:uncharacterized protein YjiS (DUF1127 family)
MRANQMHPGYCPAEPRRPAALDAVRGTAQRLAAILRVWRRRRSERRELAEFARLDNRILRDIGLTRESAEFLINKPFWRE